MRLALSDFAGDESFAGLGLPEDAHWSVRLVAKLLLERARGASSPWYPYLQAYPRTFSYHNFSTVVYWLHSHWTAAFMLPKRHLY